MTFDDDAGIHAAIDLLWGDKLRDMPWDLAGGDSVILPAEGVRFFKAAGLNFVENELLTHEELTAEELNELRKQGPY